MDIGATLRQAREAHKVTREELALATRIPLRIIAAMERNEWTAVPGGIFTRGHLRAYAHAVGLAGDPLVAQFEAEQAPPPEQEPAEPAPPPAPRTQFADWAAATRPDDAKRWLTWAGLAVAALLFVYFAGRWSSTRDGQQVSTPAGAPAQMAPSVAPGEQGSRPVGTTARRTADATVPPAATDDRSRGPVLPGDVALPAPDVALVVDLEVTRPCWVAASADGARAVFRIVHPGERVQAQGRNLTLRVGDAGAVQISIGGERARPLGAGGEVRTVRITRDNYRSLLPGRSGE
jgi:cytoskeleton protein RodZ